MVLLHLMVSMMRLLMLSHVTDLAASWKSQHYFYIYDWPDIATNYSWFQHNAMINDGAGALLDQERGLYDTWQFALYKLIYERALVDPRRTFDPLNATTFIIPYDFGLDACFRKDNGRMRKANCPLAELVHMSSNVTNPPWTLETGAKSIIASFTGSRGSYNPVSQKLRHEIAANCDAYTAAVRDDNMTSCSTATYNSNQWTKELARNSLSAKSVFCFQPPGDMPTRKSVFDSVVLGCIPVFFNRLTAPLMYNWHLGQQLWDQISINFDHLANRLFYKKNWAGLDANSTIDPDRVDLVKLLVEMYDKDFEAIRRKQKLIALHAHKLQYGVPERGTPRTPQIDGPVSAAFSLAAGVSNIVDGLSSFVHWDEEASLPEKSELHAAGNRKVEPIHNNAANSIFTELTKKTLGKSWNNHKNDDPGEGKGSVKGFGSAGRGVTAIEESKVETTGSTSIGVSITKAEKHHGGGRHKAGAARGKKGTAQHAGSVGSHTAALHRRMDAFDITIGNVLAIHAGLKSHNRTSHYMRCPGGKMAHYVDWCISTNSTEDIREDW